MSFMAGFFCPKAVEVPAVLRRVAVEPGDPATPCGLASPRMIRVAPLR